MRSREEIWKDITKDKGRPVFESGILEVLLDIRELLAAPKDQLK